MWERERGEAINASTRCVCVLVQERLGANKSGGGASLADKHGLNGNSEG